MKRLLNVSLAIALILFGFMSFVDTVSADSFNQNNIVDDGTFDNVNSMSAAAIDSFLNAFPGSCISPNSGFKAIDPIGYNPTSGYQYGGYVTAGQVIYDAAQAYGLNPQVLITTLQKEQSLVAGGTSDFCSNGDENKYAAAVGYGCPDSGTTYSYTGLSLYQRNGTTISSVGPTCVNTSSKAGFSQQVIRGAWLLKFGEQRSRGNVGWAVIKGNWNNSDDPQTCYAGPMTQGTYQRCPSGGSAYYDGYTTIDGVAVHMDSGATAALYWYTPHFHGNQVFFDTFSSWFGSTTSYYGSQPSNMSAYARSSCAVPAFDSTMVGRLYNPDLKDFLYTTSRVEACAAVTYGYIWDDVVMKSAVGEPGAIPVYRIANYERHIFTTSSSVRDDALNNRGYHDEGIAFYVYTSAAPDRTPAYGLQLGNTFFLTSAGKEADYYQYNYNYFNFGIVFYTPSLNSTQTSVYRLSRNNARFYTISTIEKNNAISAYGYKDEGVVSQNDSEPTSTDSPVYRIHSPTGIFFYTTDRNERDNAIENYGYSADGIAFYAPLYTTSPVYRATNYAAGLRVYTNSLNEYQNSMIAYGYNGEGVGWYGY